MDPFNTAHAYTEFSSDQSAMLVPPSVALDPAFRALSAANEDSKRSASAQAVQLLERQGFSIGPLNFLTAYDRASELSEMVPIYPLPNTAQWFRGLATLHGNLVPVIDVANLLRVEREVTSKSFMLVLGHGESAVAVLIDGLPKRLKLDASAAETPPALPDLIAPFVARAHTHEGHTWLEFDHENFFATVTARASA